MLCWNRIGQPWARSLENLVPRFTHHITEEIHKVLGIRMYLRNTEAPHGVSSNYQSSPTLTRSLSPLRLDNPLSRLTTHRQNRVSLFVSCRSRILWKAGSRPARSGVQVFPHKGTFLKILGKGGGGSRSHCPLRWPLCFCLCGSHRLFVCGHYLLAFYNPDQKSSRFSQRGKCSVCGST